MNDREKEKLEVLNGDRGDKQSAAVRIKHVQAMLGALNTEPSGDAAADIRALFAAINTMRTLLR